LHNSAGHYADPSHRPPAKDPDPCTQQKQGLKDSEVALRQGYACTRVLIGAARAVAVSATTADLAPAAVAGRKTSAVRPRPYRHLHPVLRPTSVRSRWEPRDRIPAVALARPPMPFEKGGSLLTLPTTTQPHKITAIHAYVFACSVSQFAPTPAFHSFTHCVPATPFQNAILSHESPGFTNTNFLQFVTIPGCASYGVGTAFACPARSSSPTHA